MHLNLSAERSILSDLLYQLASKLNQHGKYWSRNFVLNFSAIVPELSETNQMGGHRLFTNQALISGKYTEH